MAEPLAAGHYQGHWLSATSFLISSTNNQTIRAKANEIIQIFSNVMDAWKTKYGVDGYLFPYDPLGDSTDSHATF